MEHQGTTGSEPYDPTTAAQAREDLLGRGDIEALLRRFYGRVLVDVLLCEPFAEVRSRGLESHLPLMCDFWETVLFHAATYKGSAVQVHAGVHARHEFGTEHFLRWLSLWVGTVDDMYDGPVAERAKLQATRIAWSMHRRILGRDDPALDAVLLATTPLRRKSHA